jgi:RNA polymerase sigma-70 factor (ECF subfamily)
VDEAQLVERAKGDREAFGQLYDRYVRRVYGVIHARVGDRAEAEDLTAQVFLRALENLSRLDPSRGGFGAWVFRIARNLVVDRHRRNSRRVTLPVEEAPPRQGLPAPPEAGAPDGPEESAIGRERAAHLWQRVSQLPRAQRQAIELRFIHGLKTAEIAAVMGRSPAAVKQLTHRALERLRAWERDFQ